MKTARMATTRTPIAPTTPATSLAAEEFKESGLDTEGVEVGLMVEVVVAAVVEVSVHPLAEEVVVHVFEEAVDAIAEEIVVPAIEMPAAELDGCKPEVVLAEKSSAFATPNIEKIPRSITDSRVEQHVESAPACRQQYSVLEH